MPLGGGGVEGKGGKGHATLVYWPPSLGGSPLSPISAHCWKPSTRALCGVNPQAASAGLEERAVRELYHVSVLAFLFT